MMNEDRVPALDGLRGIAALTVVVSHFSNVTGLFGGALGFGAGQLGVMLFFVISGYLMGHVYLVRPFKPATFFRARIARVFPLYIAVVVASFYIQMDGQPWPYPITRANLTEHLAFVRGVSVLWTIPIEVQFYVLFAALWWLARASRAAFMTLIIGMLILSLAIGSPDFVRSLPFFLVGTLLFMLPRLPHRLADLSIVPLMALYVVAFPNLVGIGSIQISDVMIIWSSPWYLLIVAGLLYAGVSSPLANRALGSRVPAFLGMISYSIYLLHIPVLMVLSKSAALSANLALFPVAYLASVILVSSVSYYALERPARRFINQTGAAFLHSRKHI